MSFSGGEVTEKGFAQGWDPAADDQASQRALRVTQLLEAFVFRPWAWNPHESKRLTYAYNGGMVDDGSAWTFIPAGTIDLPNNELLFIERNDVGTVQAVTGGFTYPGWVPMASIKTEDGAIRTATYIDYRPEIGGAPTGTGGAITFPMILGQILDSQVPLSAVAQYQLQLCIRAAQVTPGQFGSYTACNPTGTGDYSFPRDLAILQDLFVTRDLDVDRDAFVFGNISINGTGWGIFPNRVGIGGTGVPNNTTGDPLQVQGAMSVEGAIDFYDAVSSLTHNAIFQSGTSPDIFSVLRNFQSVATLWQIISRSGDPLVDDRESTLALVRTDDAGNEELIDFFNNGYHSSGDKIGVAYGIRVQKRGTGLYRPLYIDWYDGVTVTDGIDLLSPDDTDGPLWRSHIPVQQQDQLRRGITTVTAAMTPYTWAETDWHINADSSVTDIEIMVPDAADHYLSGFTDQLHIKNIGNGNRKVRLRPAVAGQLIDGCTEAIIRKTMRCFTLVTDGSDWWIQ